MHHKNESYYLMKHLRDDRLKNLSKVQYGFYGVLDYKKYAGFVGCTTKKKMMGISM